MSDAFAPVPPPDPADMAALQKLPRIWVGYGLAFLQLPTLMSPALRNDGGIDSLISGQALLQLLLRSAGWFYWLYCVYKFHDAMMEIPGYKHPIAPSKAVAMHFIPFYNIYWAFKWPSEIAKFVNWRTQSKSMRGDVAGILVLAAILIYQIVDSILGLLLLFAAGEYVSRQIRKAFAAPPVPPPAYSAAPGVAGTFQLLR